MYVSLGGLLVSIVTWLHSAFTLEMLGWKTHRQVYLVSLFFFVANVNLLSSILDGYKSKKKIQKLVGERWTRQNYLENLHLRNILKKCLHAWSYKVNLIHA